MDRRKIRQRALRKVPDVDRRAHRAADTLIKIAEARVSAGVSRPVWWETLLVNRDLRTELESRYPILGPTKKRGPGIGEEET